MAEISNLDSFQMDAANSLTRSETTQQSMKESTAPVDATKTTAKLEHKDEDGEEEEEETYKVLHFCKFEEVDAEVVINYTTYEKADRLGEVDNSVPQLWEEDNNATTVDESGGNVDRNVKAEEMPSKTNTPLDEDDFLNHSFDNDNANGMMAYLEQLGESDKEEERTANCDDEADEDQRGGEEEKATNNNEEDVENEDKDKEVVDADNNVEKENDNNSLLGANDKKDIKGVNNSLHEKSRNDKDDTAEPVQEPEEFNVCLIPDDTACIVTDAEKEQATLVRAEKDNDNRRLDKAGDNVAENKDASEKQTEADTPDPIVAQASNTTGSEAEVNTNQDADEDLKGTNLSENPETVEPYVEEMQSTSSETKSGAKTFITWIGISTQKCVQRNEEKTCSFHFQNIETSDISLLCDQHCSTCFTDANTSGKHIVSRKKFLIEELPATNAASEKRYCLQCKETKYCKYFFKQDEDTFYLCNAECFNLLNAEEPDKFKLKRHSIRLRNIGATTISNKNTIKVEEPESTIVARTAAEVEAARLERSASFVRKCSDCFSEITLGDKNLIWEIMDFCDEICLGKFQRMICTNCRTCHGDVPHPALGKYCVRFGFNIQQFCCASCLNEFKRVLKTCFCCQKDISSGNEGSLTPVDNMKPLKDFCSQACMGRYHNITNPKKKLFNDICAVCHDKPVCVVIILSGKEYFFCSNPCFSAFKFVTNIIVDNCGMCCKYFERKSTESFTIYSEKRAIVFCCRVCLNIFLVVNRRIVSCQWCKVKKYSFDMILKQQDNQEIQMCSLNCLALYGVSINAFSPALTKCDNCTTVSTSQYCLTMSDTSIRSFCTHQCVVPFLSQFVRATVTLGNAASAPSAGHSRAGGQKSGKNNVLFPTDLPKSVKVKGTQQVQQKGSEVHIKLPSNNTRQKVPIMPVISKVSSLASGETETMIGNDTGRRTRVRGRKTDSPPPSPPIPAVANKAQQIHGRRQRKALVVNRSPTPSPPNLQGGKRERGSGAGVSNNVPSTRSTATISKANVVEKVIAQTETKIVCVPPLLRDVRNVQTSCKPQNITVGFQCEPKTCNVGTQTDKDYSNKVLIPVPVPIYVPQPMYMYSAPFPVPVPIALPIPVPIFIATTRNSAHGIMQEIKKIQDQTPADPFEAEILLMAEMVAGAEREADSDSENEVKPDPAVVSLQYNNSAQQVDVTNNSYGCEDVLQMALKMAAEDNDLPTSTIYLQSGVTGAMVQHDDSMRHNMTGHLNMQQHHMMDAQRGGRGNKRDAISALASTRNSRSPGKRQRIDEMKLEPQPMQSVEKPDVKMCLKYTFGVNAWKQWVTTKNADIEKTAMRRRPFKTELLQMRADELNYSLCLFVKEVRKPNGTEYAPDTIYYLVLGIQQYLYENGRIDNIFSNQCYEGFTDYLDEVVRKFSVLYNDTQYIVTRVEEEHLWECKQLGAHSPHVLLSTLMFFNMKHFFLTTIEAHKQLSFSHIMKHWKRTGPTTRTPGTRSVLLRFYPPDAENNHRKRKVYEQEENKENNLRCPVRLYEFYLSKCPESVKTRSDVFYLEPERSCVPDSPVWYSTQPLSEKSLQKKLHLAKMVKEVNMALLSRSLPKSPPPLPL